MSIDYKALGARISARRKELGLKQYEVCEAIEVNYKYLSNLETGRSSPSLELIMKLCSVLRTTPDYLILGIVTHSNDVADKELSDKVSRLSSKNKRLISGIIDLIDKE